MIGETFGNYRIVLHLGSGAMGSVFLGEHERIARRAAIKILAPEFAADTEILGRFFDEARATSLIRHPAIVEVLDCGVHPDGGRPYIVMEYLEGETLARGLERKGSLPWREAGAIARQIAEGLGAAHSHQIVHRDVKPANVMRLPASGAPGDTGQSPAIKVLDFGVAKLLQDTHSGGRTYPGKLVGTPEYMAPEQCGGEGTVDARTDIYGLGCVLFELVAGRPLFPVGHLGELIQAHRWCEAPPASSCADVPPALDRLIARMLAKRQADRPYDMTTVARALGELLASSGDREATSASSRHDLAATLHGRPSVGRREPSTGTRSRRPAVILAAGLLVGAGGAGAAVRLVHGAGNGGLAATPARVMRPPPPAPKAERPPAPAIPAAPITPPVGSPQGSSQASVTGSGLAPPARPSPAIQHRTLAPRRARSNQAPVVDTDGIVKL